MISTSIPKDIRKFKTKFALGFTLREFVCILIAGAVSLFIYNIQKLWTSEPVLDLCVFCIIPLAFGFIPPSMLQGLTLEQYLKSTFVNNYLSPKHRVYKRENPYRQFTSDNIVCTDFDVVQESDEWKEHGLNQMTAKERKACEKEKSVLARTEPELYKGY